MSFFGAFLKILVEFFQKTLESNIPNLEENIPFMFDVFLWLAYGIVIVFSLIIIIDFFNRHK